MKKNKSKYMFIKIRVDIKEAMRKLRRLIKALEYATKINKQFRREVKKLEIKEEAK